MTSQSTVSNNKTDANKNNFEANTKSMVNEFFNIFTWLMFQINLGVSTNNPSTLNGAITILEELHKYVPRKSENGEYP